MGGITVITPYVSVFVCVCQLAYIIAHVDELPQNLKL